MQNRTISLGLLCGALSGGCSSGDGGYGPADEGAWGAEGGESTASDSAETYCEPEQEIIWEGRPTTAQRCNGVLLVEGDIEVTLPLGPAGEQLRVAPQGAHRKWPRNEAGVVVIPFEFIDNPEDPADGVWSEAERDLVRAALDDIEDVVPALDFRASTAGDERGLIFRRVPGGICSSPVGFGGGKQSVRLTQGCINGSSKYHEVLHSLGLLHEHTRTDRDDHLRVNWANIRGCRDGATSIDGCGAGACAPAMRECCTEAQEENNRCFLHGNFRTNDRRKNMFEYDFQSVMHYRPNGFSKNGLVVLEPHDPAQTISRRTPMSDSDIRSLNVLYPQFRTHRVFFEGTGRHRLCGLEGRGADDGTFYRYSVSSGGSGFGGGGFGEGVPFLDTDAVAQGEFNASCGAESVFWAEKYDYPNSSFQPALSQYPADDIESHESGSFVVRVLSPGVIPALL